MVGLKCVAKPKAVEQRRRIGGQGRAVPRVRGAHRVRERAFARLARVVDEGWLVPNPELSLTGPRERADIDDIRAAAFALYWFYHPGGSYNRFPLWGHRQDDRPSKN